LDDDCRSRLLRPTENGMAGHGGELHAGNIFRGFGEETISGAGAHPTIASMAVLRPLSVRKRKLSRVSTRPRLLAVATTRSAKR